MDKGINSSRIIFAHEEKFFFDGETRKLRLVTLLVDLFVIICLFMLISSNRTLLVRSKKGLN